MHMLGKAIKWYVDKLIAPIKPRQVADGVVDCNKSMWSNPVIRSNWFDGRSANWKFDLQRACLWEVMGWLRHIG